MSFESKSTATLNDYITYGVLLSVVLHVALVIALTRRPITAAAPEVMMVELVTLPPHLDKLLTGMPPVEKALERQIVGSPDRSDAAPPKDTRLLSDKDYSAEKEQIRRGDGPEAGPVIGPGVPGAPSQVEAPPVQAPGKESPPKSENASGRKGSAMAPSGRLDLALDQQMLRDAARQGRRAAAAASGGGSAPSMSQGAPSPRPFSRAPGSGAQFLGLNGLADYLPNLPDGDITLLNAKAEKYAVFVGRVATQVFYQIKLQGWSLVRAEDINQAKEYTVIRAVLSPTGELLSATVEQRSGSRRFDDALQSAVEKGARDPHPPPDSAASDGNFRFIFMAKSWVQFGGSPTSGIPVERRWLLLRTGLE